VSSRATLSVLRKFCFIEAVGPVINYLLYNCHISRGAVKDVLFEKNSKYERLYRFECNLCKLCRSYFGMYKKHVFCSAILFLHRKIFSILIVKNIFFTAMLSALRMSDDTIVSWV
jgi:hypothetical protein